MKTKVILLSIIFSIMLMVGCTRIGPGHAGIVVKQAGSNRGVLNQAATTGWVWYNPFGESVIEYQTSMRCVKWTADPNEGKKDINEEITFTNQDQMVVKADIGTCFSLNEAKLPEFYVKFLARDEDELMEKFTDGYLKNTVRNCMNDFAGKYSITQLMGDNAGFLAESRKCITEDVAKYGISIDQYGLLAAPRPPDAVIAAINSKSQTEQQIRQAQLQIEQSKAEAQKQVAQAEGDAQATLARAEAQAKANKLLSESITDNLIKYQAIQKWDGKRPQVEGNSGGLLLQVK